MLSEEEKKLYQDVCASWGVTDQIAMVFEECSELMQALCKLRRNRCKVNEVVTEMADVSIMIDQLKVLFVVEDDFEKEKKYKIERLADRLNEWYGKNAKKIENK